jgi:hypothetical protein
MSKESFICLGVRLITNNINWTKKWSSSIISTLLSVRYILTQVVQFQLRCPNFFDPEFLLYPNLGIVYHIEFVGLIKIRSQI